MRRIPRTRGALTGLALIALGAWGALVPFVGPYFDYQIGTDEAWDWSQNRLLLEVIPGIVAALGGLMLLGGATRASTRLGGWLALLAGIWFVIGPTASMLWEDGALGTGAAFGGTETRVAEWLGFFYGLGALITALGAYAIGMLTTRPVVAEPPAAVEREERPRRRRFGRIRRARADEAEQPVASRRP